MFYTQAERLEASFNKFYTDNIKQYLKDNDGDLQMAEEQIEDDWVQYALAHFDLADIREVL